MERLTPVDLERTQLPKSMRGYEPGAVDTLIKRVAKDLEELLAENKTLKGETYDLARDLKRFREQETMLTEALVLAQKTAESVRSTAAHEAEVIVAEARVRASEIIRDAETRKDEAFWEIEKVRQQQSTFESRFREVLEEHLAHLNRRMPEFSLVIASENAA
jgi:cell division initiation protein